MKRHALFVGVDKYADPTIRDLSYPSEDATELASVFRRLLKFDCVEKLVNPSHAPEVVDAIKSITRGLGPGDLFLFFFAGHGFRVKQNHVLVCAKDEFADLEDAYAGLPVGQLKKWMRGPWNRMLVLDACQNDIRKTRGADCGVALRDLKLIHGSEAGAPDAGLQVVITSCSEGQKALEVSDLGHGLFTSAFLDSVTAFADSRRRMDLEVLRTDLGVRMGRLINKYQLRDKQVPMFTMPTDAGSIVLFNGDGPAVSQQPTIVPHVVPTAPSLVKCPICGRRKSKPETFDCRECGRENICIDHQDRKTFLCEECSTKRAHAAAAARKAEAERLIAQSKSFYDKGDDFYYGRNGCRKDYEESVKWYRKAAEQGHAPAQCKLGFVYEIGQGVDKDYNEAIKWYHKAAGQGLAVAQYNLGVAYLHGFCVAKDEKLAVKWFRAAAKQGNVKAQENLKALHKNIWWWEYAIDIVCIIAIVFVIIACVKLPSFATILTVWVPTSLE